MSREIAPRVAEFFAGAGLVRIALEAEGFSVVFANDIDRIKREIYAANLDASHFMRCDIREILGEAVPSVDLATASFPCTDLSLAGDRAGLDGKESGVLWQFLRVLHKMGDRKPKAVLLENVIGFATSKNGSDLRSVISGLNEVGYVCDVCSLDARSFVPQSRPRLFVVASTERLPWPWKPSALRPEWIGEILDEEDLSLHAFPLPELPACENTLADIVERPKPTDPSWWGVSRLGAFLVSLSPIQSKRLEKARTSWRKTWSTAYRRTRKGKPVWEIRADAISGCLRTGRGGSSRQAVVESGYGQVQVRWMTAREYARLQGVPDLKFGKATENQARFALGDAVCVPVISWLARHYLMPLVTGNVGSDLDDRAEAISVQASPEHPNGNRRLCAL